MFTPPNLFKKLSRFARKFFAWRLIYARGAWRYYQNNVTGDRKAVAMGGRLWAPDRAWIAPAPGRGWIAFNRGTHPLNTEAAE